MEQDLKYAIARRAASGLCRCHKCNGTINDTGKKCIKVAAQTCSQWIDGYKAVLIALDDERIEEFFKNK